MSDLTLIIYWWLILTVFQAAFLPLTTLLFSRFRDSGYAFSRIIGLLTTAYLFWFLGSVKIFNFQYLGVWVLGLLALPWLIIVYKRPDLKTSFLKLGQRQWRWWLLEESLFAGGLLFFAWVRSFQPNIEGLEKYMDLGFVNSILRSNFLPPKDIWLTGSTINYYYFGHYLTAFLTKISSLPSQYTYNLMIATIFGLSLSAAFSLVYNLVHLLTKSPLISLGSGLLAGWLVNLAGNLHALIYAFRKGVTYWYPDATRYIGYNPDVPDKTIHEFPSYSYVVSDLHGHMINIPNVILTVALIYYFVQYIVKAPSSRLRYAYSSFIALLLAITYMTNTWDLPIYFGLLVLTLIVFSLITEKNSTNRLFLVIFYPLIIGIMWFGFTLPYNLNFVNFSKGIGATWSHSRIYQLLVLWGFFLWFTLSYLILFLKDLPKKTKKIKTISLNLLPFYPLLMAAVSLMLIITPEFFYLKDIYIKEYYRANTMFKLGYQAFIMFSLVSAITIGYGLHRKNTTWVAKSLKIGWLLISAALVAAVSIYPYFAIVRGYYGNLKNRQSLDGWQYLKTSNPGDLSAIQWLKTNVSGQPVVLEAVGDSYTLYARISANTGLPTVLGWPVHEWLWRGSYDEAGKRTAEVQQAYEGTVKTDLAAFLNKYQVAYIIIGQLEKEKYPKLNESVITQVALPVYSDQGTTIYQVQR
jgi:uncharacterized membrane protein